MSITRALHRAQQQHGSRPAMRGDPAIDWNALAGRVACFAGGLAAHGAGPGERVAILALNGPRYLETLFAVAWAGAAVVPLNVRLAVAELRFVLDDADPRLVLLDDAFIALAGELAADGRRTIVYLGDGAAPAGAIDGRDLVAAHAPVADADLAPELMAGLFYTGGTTGRAKGVMLSHGNLLANAANLLTVHDFGSTSVFLHAAPMFHLADLASTFALSLMGGSHAFLPRFSPEAFVATVERHGVTDTTLVPTMIAALVDHLERTAAPPSSLRRVLFGGAPMAEALLARARAVLPAVQFVQGYGQTEASPLLTVMPWADLATMPTRAASAGRALPLVDLRVVDSEDRDVAVGTIGEIVARGPNVMPGYWNRPDETATTLRHGWLHTGDAGFLDADGYLFLVDRVKDMIVSGGENVYSVEVENCLAAHPAVLSCAVFGIPDERWGEAVHAVVVVRPGVAVEAEALREFCRDRIAAYKVPRRIDLRDAPLPLSGAGKILKAELRAPFWAGRHRQVG